MSTRTGAMPVERSYLLRAWIVASADVVAAAIAISLLLSASSGPSGSNAGRPAVKQPAQTQIADYGSTATRNEPIVVNGTPCMQCR